MENIIESKNQIPTVYLRVEDIEKKRAVAKFKEGLVKEVVRHASRCKKGRSKCIACASVVGQMSINELNWKDLGEVFPTEVYGKTGKKEEI